MKLLTRFNKYILTKRVIRCIFIKKGNIMNGKNENERKIYFGKRLDYYVPVKMSYEMLNNIMGIANKLGVTRSKVIRMIIKQYFERKEEQ